MSGVVAKQGRPGGGRVGAGHGRERAGQVQSLSRALGILRALAQHDAGMTLTEISHTVGLAPSTAHRLLTTLQQEGHVRFGRERGTWQIGVEAFVIGSAFVRSRDITAFARPFMRELMEASGETVNLAVTEQGEVTYLAQVECRQMMRALARPGARVAMHYSAVGKALLANLPTAEVSEIVAQRGLSRLTPKTVATEKQLLTALEAVRRDGYAVDDEEHSLGLRCVAAPIFDEHGEAVAALSLSGPTVRISDERMAVLGGMVRHAAEEITAAYGGRLAGA